MKKVTLFLASSAELKLERERFEIEIYRKSKALFDQGIFLHLEIWEDHTARMALDGTQNAYNERIKFSDIFVLLAHTKLGIYTAEEFEAAFGQFQATEKPFIFAYFKALQDHTADSSLVAFQNMLRSLNHFYARFSTVDDLWNQFNKELDRLISTDFREFIPRKTGRNPKEDHASIVGDKNVTISNVHGSTINVQIDSKEKQAGENPAT